jgi:hypothetical protein
MLLLLDEEVPPMPPLEDEPPTLLLPGEELPAPPALLDEPPPALPPLWLLLLELLELEPPPDPARDELLLLDPPPPELDFDEFSDVPPEDELPLPLVPPPLSELLLAALAQATSERAAPRIRAENDRKGVRGEGMESEVTPPNACGKPGTNLAKLLATRDQPSSHPRVRPCFGTPPRDRKRGSQESIHVRTRNLSPLRPNLRLGG